MTEAGTTHEQQCVFCAIVAGQSDASVVHQDETAVAFMSLHPVVRGHLLVVPRKHAVGLEDLDLVTSAHVWSVGHDMARALRRSTLRCEGINVLVCDGDAAFQTVFHFHLQVIPRYPGDGWTIVPDEVERERSLLDGDAHMIRDSRDLTRSVTVARGPERLPSPLASGGSLADLSAARSSCYRTQAET